MRKGDFRLILTTNYCCQEDFIESVGWLDQESLAHLYRKVDICVVPSVRPEPFGIVALEVMASGKPLIITKVEGLQRIVKDGYTGFIVEPNRVDELKDKLEILMDDEELRWKLGARAREVIEQNYDWDIVYNKYYEQIFK